MAPPKFIINEPIPIRGGPNDRSRKPPIIEITQSTSQPADQDAPSFLTTLPAEIRNAVYNILFKHDGPIEIMDRKEQRKYPAWIEEGWYSDYSDEEDAELEAASYLMRKTHDLDQGINLLRTCRQIYWEAIRTLYSANSFCVTAPDHRHNSNLLLVTTATEFIQSIGTHFFLLTELPIDLGRVCPMRCTNSDFEDILPLLRVLWSRPSIVPKVFFTAGQYKLCPELHQDHEGIGSVFVTRANQVLHKLSDTDELGLRRCGRFERLLLEIYICVRESRIPQEQGWITHWSYDVQDLKIDDTDGVSTLSLEPTHTLKDLSTRPYHRILGYALSSCDSVIFDLHTHVVSNLKRSILQLDQFTRRAAIKILRKQSQITLRLETRQTVTSFEDFDKLREWLEGPYGPIVNAENLCDDSIDFCPAPRIVLNFNSPDLNLASLRINIQSFIRLTYAMNKNTIVRFSIGSTEATRCPEEVYEIGLQTLRRRCFILLSLMLLQKPSYGSFLAPEIWIDGTGTPIEVAWSVPKAGRIIRGPNHPLDPTALRTTGLEYVKDISGLLGDGFCLPWPEANYSPCRQYRLIRGPSLRSMWLSLRFFDWGNDV